MSIAITLFVIAAAALAYYLLTRKRNKGPTGSQQEDPTFPTKRPDNDPWSNEPKDP